MVVGERVQADVARECGLSPSTLSRWLSGEIVPDKPERLKAVLSACQAAPDVEARIWVAMGVPQDVVADASVIAERRRESARAFGGP